MQRLRVLLDRELSITDLFRFATVRSLAQHLGGGTREPVAALHPTPLELTKVGHGPAGREAVDQVGSHAVGGEQDRRLLVGSGRGAETAGEGLAGAGAAVASSAARTATTRAAASERGRRRASMGTFLKPAMDAGAELNPETR